ncbi:hypothetical protein T08_7107 [Trichinella sp. T8]|uniref:Uncharacterized protein n=1 Tax=Trichinella murrelli TaxID=144512 RepID=A0A0V0TGI6_9BILA|nr:hypothetical protein T05_8398 [Trichinella murrelli]KRZ83706.1 hypothetical protein T08_7107 [Trichinella sp. T8]
MEFIAFLVLLNTVHYTVLKVQSIMQTSLSLPTYSIGNFTKVPIMTKKIKKCLSLVDKLVNSKQVSIYSDQEYNIYKSTVQTRLTKNKDIQIDAALHSRKTKAAHATRHL